MKREDVLVSPAQLEPQLGDPELRIFDCSVHLAADEERAGRDVYDTGHVPGAAFLDVLADLADPSLISRDVSADLLLPLVLSR